MVNGLVGSAIVSASIKEKQNKLAAVTIADIAENSFDG
jgi:hypothetical protein